MIKWIKRILLSFIAIVLLFALILASIIIYDANFGTKATDVTNITYTDSQGNILNGYLATPQGQGPHPAILLTHEWWGLNKGITILADALAQEGYVVLAPDAHRNRVTATVPRALWMALTTPTEQIFADMDTALAYLRTLDTVDPNRIAAMGFCFGGGQSLQLGLRQPQNLAVIVIYYGTLVTDPDLLRPLAESAPILGVFAEEDERIFPTEVLEFEAALNSLNIENQITIYQDVGHAFINEHNFNQPGTAADAWQEAIIFLENNLKNR